MGEAVTATHAATPVVVNVTESCIKILLFVATTVQRMKYGIIACTEPVQVVARLVLGFV
jgi:hypothetical protein